MGIFRIVYFSENHLDYLDYDADGVKAQLQTILKSSQSTVLHGWSRNQHLAIQQMIS
jgi:hypothetical protein